MQNHNSFASSSNWHRNGTFFSTLSEDDDREIGPPWLDHTRPRPDESLPSASTHRLPPQQAPSDSRYFTNSSGVSFIQSERPRVPSQALSRPTLPHFTHSSDRNSSAWRAPVTHPPSDWERYDHYVIEPHPVVFQRSPSEALSPIMPSAPPSRKRVAIDSGRERPKKIRQNSEDLEEINLTSDDPMEAVLEQERQELVKSQQKDDEDGPKPFGKMSCIICMDTFTDVTATACGHIFCHECLSQALHASEKNDRGVGSCPVCRKQLKRTTKNHIIPLALMTRKTFREQHPRR
ncbi:hypothetical protein BDZ85DRAFT_294255 [Elsinoe ampelina]|uniref:RING-type domain-containing protein n=1 Tax=Elsinoe ampelina TaxID=302913 RepID=A0A6A6GJ92_9PEZI|nr:hypothetical protein BDZ85DRAFT_294255 [Elsinoe ampelina]